MIFHKEGITDELLTWLKANRFLVPYQTLRFIYCCFGKVGFAKSKYPYFQNVIDEIAREKCKAKLICLGIEKVLQKTSSLREEKLGW